MLALIEKEITAGEPIADYFDTIAGTSTGGIIALGLGLKKPAAEIEKLYVVDGHLVFPEHWKKQPIRRLFRQLRGPAQRLHQVDDVGAGGAILLRERLSGALLVDEVDQRGFVLVLELRRLEPSGLLVAAIPPDTVCAPVQT
jgi:hypothetical protein